ncbi:hypothetical protein MRB53_035423 [Persea americana]|uniref:Uncharacterized protein n=1 Tax=Persea americana TaxID=3435 RepID=A0ACC2K4N0_PERAE|nr:hypothetical protein MRB53_035423 [Persea americana]
MNVAAANLSDNVSVAFVHGLLLNMGMRLNRHRASSSSPFDQTTSALFTPKTSMNTNSSHGGGRHNRGRGRGGYQGGCGSSQSLASNKPITNVSSSIVLLHDQRSKSTIALGTLRLTAIITWIMRIKDVILLINLLQWLLQITFP